MNLIESKPRLVLPLEQSIFPAAKYNLSLVPSFCKLQVRYILVTCLANYFMCLLCVHFVLRVHFDHILCYMLIVSGVLKAIKDQDFNTHPTKSSIGISTSSQLHRGSS